MANEETQEGYRKEYRSGFAWNVQYHDQENQQYPLNAYIMSTDQDKPYMEIKHVEGTDLAFGEFELLTSDGGSRVFRGFDEALDSANDQIIWLGPQMVGVERHELTGDEGIYHIGEADGKEYSINADEYTDVKHGYWFDKGKHQDILSAAGEKMPNVGYTPNDDMNLFIAMSQVYYDLHNNDGCNIQSGYRTAINQHILPKMPEFDALRLVDGDHAYAEEQMDKMLEQIQGKSLDYPVYEAWFDNDKELVSKQEPSDNKGWTRVTFGFESERDQWVDGRVTVLGFKEEDKNRPYPNGRDTRSRENMNDFYEYRNPLGETEEVQIHIGQYYNNGNIFVGLASYSEELGQMLPYCDITVNIEKLPYCMNTVDTNNLGTGIIDFLTENGIAKQLHGQNKHSGFCEYPVFVFNEDILRKADPELFAEYQLSYGMDPSLGDAGEAAKETTTDQYLEHYTGKTYEYHTHFGDTEVVEPVLNVYADNGNIFMGLQSYDPDLEAMDSYCDVTVNVRTLGYPYAAINNTLSGDAIIHFLEDNGFGKVTDQTIRSGFAEYPVFAFNPDRLKEIDPQVFAEYRMGRGMEPEQENQNERNSSIQNKDRTQEKTPQQSIDEIVDQARERAMEKDNADHDAPTKRLPDPER